MSMKDPTSNPNPMDMLIVYTIDKDFLYIGIRNDNNFEIERLNIIKLNFCKQRIISYHN